MFIPLSWAFGDGLEEEMKKTLKKPKRNPSVFRRVSEHTTRNHFGFAGLKNKNPTGISLESGQSKAANEQV